MSEQQSMPPPDAVLSFAHRRNIQKYRQLLRTPLTAHERGFVERRLAEEQAALEGLQRSNIR